MVGRYVCPMNKMLAVILVLILSFTSYQGFAYFRKFKHAKRIKVALESYAFPKLKLSSLLSDILFQVNLSIGNYSSSQFSLEQVSIEVFSPSGLLIAEQKEPMSEPLILSPNKNTILPLTFWMASHRISDLIRENGGAANVGANYITSGEYGIPLRLKGFVVAEGFQIGIDQEIKV